MFLGVVDLLELDELGEVPMSLLDVLHGSALSTAAVEVLEGVAEAEADGDVEAEAVYDEVDALDARG